MTQTYTLTQHGNVVLQSDEFAVREKIEELLEEKTGVFVSLQEFTDDGAFEFYLHSEAGDDLSDAEWDTLTKQYGIDHNETQAEAAIRKLLDIQIH